ncbi:MAG: tetratricopeptide repeat protein [Treponema sp.]|nr:tetratricopeptide repeat protein [Treponema sp.]
MRRSRFIFWLIFTALFLFCGNLIPADENGQFLRRFHNGAGLYSLQKWQEAVIEFRRAQEMATNTNDFSRAIYWVILSELALADYGSALRDMDELQRIAPNSHYARDMVYHRARINFNLGYFEDALVLFNNFLSSTGDTDRESSDRRAAAFFWMGESLFAMGQLDEAEKFYAWVIGRYPESLKIEASSYRIDLIKQKKIENELLALLQWSHEESLRTSEEFQRTIRTYEHTLNLYQRRIAELSATVSLQELSVPEIVPPVVEVPVSNPMDNLMEKARQLGINVDDILKHETVETRESLNGGGN